MQELNIETGDISIQEVEKAQTKLKNNKAPGPDGSIAELYAWLKDCGQGSLHHALNENWKKHILVKHENAANIASLHYKKGDHENPENYRPISLLNITYKLMAHIIHERISCKIDLLLGNNQSGFRKGRSTIDPIYCVRSLQDIV